MTTNCIRLSRWVAERPHTRAGLSFQKLRRPVEQSKSASSDSSRQSDRRSLRLHGPTADGRDVDWIETSGCVGHCWQRARRFGVFWLPGPKLNWTQTPYRARDVPVYIELESLKPDGEQI